MAVALVHSWSGNLSRSVFWGVAGDLTTNPHVPPMEDRRSGSSSGTRARHQQIRDTALHLFFTEGYGNVSLRQLAAALGLSAGSLYNHLENKQQLLFELINDHLQNVLNRAESEVSKVADMLEQLKPLCASISRPTFSTNRCRY
ncbi:TetR/AcrR family transcriptional regulator [Pseudomonas mohnii]